MGYEKPAHIDLFDGIALRRDLTALARDELDPDERRKAALAYIKPILQELHRRIAARIENGTLSGLWAARALSDVHDLLI